jgi:V8-like Glu-specific endopeptidase/endonuclease/exonuclease/phosphatase family metal-dependent hydrolase
MVKKTEVPPITLSRLLEMLRDEDIDDHEIRPYLKLDEERSTAFDPAITYNPELVTDDATEEGQVFLASFNWFSKRKRQKRYRKKIKGGFSGIRMVSEGDSWFQYPVLLDDVIDQLFDDYAIFSLGGAGHLLKDIIDEDEITEAVRREMPAFLLLSGGGNDMVGDARLATMVDKYDSKNPDRPAADYLDDDFDTFLSEIRDLYHGLFSRLHARFPKLKILTHGYDWALPADGKWLGKPLKKQAIRKMGLQKAIVREMIDRFNAVILNLAEDFEHVVYHVDCRGAVAGKKSWHDELHPKNDGYKSVADRFRTTVNLAMSDALENAPEPLCPGKDQALDSASNLSNMNFDQLTLRRARQLDIDVLPSSPRYDHTSCRSVRKEAETEISNHLEKIDLTNDFLKARFLKDGSNRSKAVCRIRTPVSLGSGFLIASNTYIMTNNHVLPDIEVARDSRAQFGFEENATLLEVNLTPGKFFLTNKKLDYTIVACEAVQNEDIDAIPLLRNPSTITRGERVNIIQHPRGREKEIAIRNNEVIWVKNHVVHYRTDTEPGSSGSAVFNDAWQLVALHHAGWSDDGSRATNEGIRMASIVADLTTRLRRGTETSTELVDLVDSVSDTSPYLGFFDTAGVTDFTSDEVEVPEFRGEADFADIMFWNIEHFNKQVSNDRVDKVADVLSSFAMDVVGLVEVQEEAMHRLKSSIIARGMDADFELLNVRGSQDLAVLYNRETTSVSLRTDLNERYRSQLSIRTPGGKTAFPRAPLFAQVSVQADNSNPIEFLMIVLHLKAFGDASSRRRRKLAAETLVNIIDDIRDRENLAVVMGGDYNDVLNTDVFASLQSTPDLFALTADDSSGGATTYVGGSHHSVIDHIVISSDLSPAPISGDDAAIVRLDRSMANFSDQLSDHVPLAMRLVSRTGAVPIDTGDAGGAVSISVPENTSSMNITFE